MARLNCWNYWPNRWPRHPYPTISSLHWESYGFPSGAAQTAMVLGFLLVYGWKSRWAWPCATLYVLIISASRVLLGVHFVVDLLGGWGLGVILGGLFVALIHPLESFASRKSGVLLSEVLAIAVLGLAILPAKISPLFIMAAVGSIGVFISTKYGLYLPIERRSVCRRTFHGLAAAGGVLLLSLMPDFFGYQSNVAAALIAIWITLLVSPFCKRLM